MKVRHSLWLGLFIVSCKMTPVKKAQWLIDSAVKVSLHDYKSYEPVVFGKLDTAYSKVEDNPELKDLQEAFDKANRDGESELEEAKIYAGSYYTRDEAEYHNRLAKIDLVRMIGVQTRMDSLKRTFVPIVTGWKMEHSYRAKSLGGNFGIHHYMYYFDPGLSTILKYEDVGEK